MVAPAAVPVTPLPVAGADKSRRPVRKPRRGTVLQRRKDRKRPRPAVYATAPNLPRLIVNHPDIRHEVSFSAYLDHTSEAIS